MNHLESKNPVSSHETGKTKRKEYVKPTLECFGVWEIPTGQAVSVPCNPDCGPIGEP